MLEGHDPYGTLIGVTLGSYQFTERIGAGGMGVVYRAQDLGLGRTVAERAVSPYVATVLDVVEQGRQRLHQTRTPVPRPTVTASRIVVRRRFPRLSSSKRGSLN